MISLNLSPICLYVLASKFLTCVTNFHEMWYEHNLENSQTCEVGTALGLFNPKVSGDFLVHCMSYEELLLSFQFNTNNKPWELRLNNSV